MEDNALHPVKCVAYLVMLREQNSRILAEFAVSYKSLRRFHPDLPVVVYHHNLMGAELDYLEQLEGVRCVPIGLDAGRMFSEQRYREAEGWNFPELFALTAKIDAMLLTPGDTLFLDTDTEVVAPLDECLSSDTPWMHMAEGHPEGDTRDLFAQIPWQAMGWRGDLRRMRIYDAGSIYVPQACKHHLYLAKQLLWSQLRPADQDQLDEQMALSIALQESVQYQLPEIAPRVYHYSREKRDKQGDWYQRVHGFRGAWAGEPQAVVSSPRTLG